MKRTEILNLGKHFTIIDSPVPFWLIDNYGFRAYRPAGAWQFDNWKLLPEKFHKIYPVYTLSIEWESGLNDNENPTFTETDLDLGDGIAGVNGQPVNVTGDIGVKIKSPLVQVGDQEAVAVHLETNLQPLEVVSKGNNIIDNFSFVGFVRNIYSVNEFLNIISSFGFEIGVSSELEFFVKKLVLKKGSTNFYLSDECIKIEYLYSASDDAHTLTVKFIKNDGTIGLFEIDSVSDKGKLDECLICGLCKEIE